MRNYINSQLGLIRFLLTALGDQALKQQQQQRKEEEDREEEEEYKSPPRRRGRRKRKATRNGRDHLGPGSVQVGAPASPGQSLPSPRRNLTRRSPPPAPRLLGPCQSRGAPLPQHHFPPRRPPAPRTPRGPRARRSSRDSQLPIPDSSPRAALPQSLGPSQTRRPAPPPAPGRAGAPHSHLGPGVRGRDAAVPEPPKAGVSTRPHPLRLLTPPAAPRYLRAASGLLPPQTRPLGGGEGVAGRGPRRLGSGELAECTTTRPGGGQGPRR